MALAHELACALAVPLHRACVCAHGAAAASHCSLAWAVGLTRQILCVLVCPTRAHREQNIPRALRSYRVAHAHCAPTDQPACTATTRPNPRRPREAARRQPPLVHNKEGNTNVELRVASWLWWVGRTCARWYARAEGPTNSNWPPFDVCETGLGRYMHSVAQTATHVVVIQASRVLEQYCTSEVRVELGCTWCSP